MPTDPITLPLTTDDVGTVGMTVVYTGLRRRHWWHVAAVTASMTTDEDDEFLAVDGDGTGGVTITLDPNDGQAIIIYAEILTTGNTITIDTATGHTIDGGASLTITVQGGFVHLIHDGTTNWLLYIDGR